MLVVVGISLGCFRSLVVVAAAALRKDEGPPASRMIQSGAYAFRRVLRPPAL